MPQVGVKTGADQVFLVAAAAAWTRPAVRGRDVAAWRTPPRAHVLGPPPAAGGPLGRLPRELARLLEPHLERLRRRSDYRTGAPWQVFRTGLAYAPHRVVWADVARRIAAAVPPPDVVPLNTVYGIATRTAEDAHALAALFNSRWLTALARLVADPARGGFARFNAGVVRGLPLPPAESSGWLALAAAGSSGVADDALVADLYHLDASDRRVLAPLAPLAAGAADSF